jgi:hypothetical protein
MKLHCDFGAVIRCERSANLQKCEVDSLKCYCPDSNDARCVLRGKRGCASLDEPLVRRSIELLALTLFVFLAAPASAKQMAWQGTLEVRVSRYDPLLIEGTGVATLNNSEGGTQLGVLRLAGGITGSDIVPFTDPIVTGTNKSIRVTAQLGTGTLSPFWPSAPIGESQLVRNTLPVRGVARVCTFTARCEVGLVIPLAVSDEQKAIGVGGEWTVGGYGADRFSIQAAPWTLTASLLTETVDGEPFTATTGGWIHGPSSWAGSAGATGGDLSVVTPMRIIGSDGIRLPAFVRLSLRFVPEPSAPLLLGAGFVGLVTIGAIRKRALASDHDPRVEQSDRKWKKAREVRDAGERKTP